MNKIGNTNSAVNSESYTNDVAAMNKDCPLCCGKGVIPKFFNLESGTMSIQLDPKKIKDLDIKSIHFNKV